MKNPAAPQSTGGGSASLKTMTKGSPKALDISRRSRSYVYQRVERKAPWEPRRVEGDGHVMATCGFTRPRSFTEDNAFHQFIVTSYGRGGGVGRGLGGGLDLGVGVGPWGRARRGRCRGSNCGRRCGSGCHSSRSSSRWRCAGCGCCRSSWS